MPIQVLGLLLLISLLGAGGVYFLKSAVRNVFAMPHTHWMTAVPKLFLHPQLLLAVLLYGAAFAVLISILRNYEVIKVFPAAVAMNILFSVLVAVFFLHEPMTWPRGLGIGLIMMGVYFVR